MNNNEYNAIVPQLSPEDTYDEEHFRGKMEREKKDGDGVRRIIPLNQITVGM